MRLWEMGKLHGLKIKLENVMVSAAYVTEQGLFANVQ